MAIMIQSMGAAVEAPVHSRNSRCLRNVAAIPSRSFSTLHHTTRLAAFSSSRKITLRHNSCIVRSNYGETWNTPGDQYLTIGLAHCFEKADNGKLIDRFIIEPISANALECMANGGKTCFAHVYSLLFSDAASKSKDVLPAQFQDAIFCENYVARADACARTWMRPHAMDNLLNIVPLGQVKSHFNFDLTDKRVLNMENIVNDDDNIKQDISIDVYGRKEIEALHGQNSPQQKKKEDEQQQEEDDGLDGLLAA